MKIDFTKIFNHFYVDVATLLNNILTSIIVFILFVIAGKLFFKIIGNRIQKKWKDSIISSFIAQAAKWVIYIFGVITALSILGFGGIAGSLMAGAGVSAIVFGFAFKDIGENFLSGIILALKRPFEIGDIIEVDGYKGNVKDLDLRTTHLRNVEGKDIYIPNSAIIKSTLINYTKDGNLRINFIICIAPECSIDQTRDLILKYLASNKQILKDPRPNVLVKDLGEFTVDLQVLFWVDILVNKDLPDVYLGHSIRSKAITDIKDILDKNNIEMPSQVLEHKMYRDKTLQVNSSN